MQRNWVVSSLHAGFPANAARLRVTSVCLSTSDGGLPLQVCQLLARFPWAGIVQWKGINTVTHSYCDGSCIKGFIKDKPNHFDIITGYREVIFFLFRLRRVPQTTNLSLNIEGCGITEKNNTQRTFP